MGLYSIVECWVGFLYGYVGWVFGLVCCTVGVGFELFVGQICSVRGTCDFSVCGGLI